MAHGKTDMVERIDFFIDSKLKTYIVDIDDNYYFAELISKSDNHIQLYNFDGKRKGKFSKLLIINIKKIDEYKSREVLENE